MAAEDHIRFHHRPDVDGYQVEVDGKTMGVVDQEDLDDYCPLWKNNESAASDALLEQIAPYLHD